MFSDGESTHIDAIQKHMEDKSIFGEWVSDLRSLKVSSKPFDHIVIDNFFNETHAHSFYEEVQSFSSKELWVYENSFESQRVMNKWDQFGPAIYKSFFELCDSKTEKMFGKLFNIKIRADIGLHGGGVVLYPNGGKLNVHLDYETHPKLNAVRNLNLLVYLNPNWLSEWGGGLNLYSEHRNGNIEISKKIECKFNRAIIFNTDQNSWHGLPEKISCPNDQARTALNFYYLNDAGKVGTNERFRAQFIASDEQKIYKKGIQELAKERMKKDNPKYD